MTALARRLLALAAAAALLGGCGYGVRGNLPDHIKTVAVPMFKNKTLQPAVENSITGAVINAFVNSGTLKVVPVDQADAILEGEITDYSIDALSFDRRLNVREYRLRVTLNIQFRDVTKNVLLWKENGLSQEADFRVEGQVSDTLSREEGAVGQAAVEIGRKVATQAVDRF
ncbi:MAG TPA: LptE family protein [Methylomirabilota bacterium]|jgi:outer membrane lipopolysaccharide assembly protein LptE/RlpB|nr:LptE family protein [Methylomirabilota bacterium]